MPLGNNSEGVSLVAFVKSERQWSRRSRLARAKSLRLKAIAAGDTDDAAFYRAVVRLNDYDALDKLLRNAGLS